MLLAALYITPAVPIAARATSPTAIVVDSLSTHSAGPNPGIATTVNSIVTMTIEVQNINGPLDMQAWNIAGRVDPSFFKIAGLPTASVSVLKTTCSANGGFDLYAQLSDSRTGRFFASEFCGGLAPGTGYIGTGGALLTVKLKVLKIGVSTISLDSGDTFLVSVSGDIQTNIPAALTNGVFTNTPAFSADLAGGNVQGSKTISLGTTARYHIPLTSTGAVTMQAQLNILKPNGKTVQILSGPIAVTGTGDAFFDFTPATTGFYQVTAVTFWSEDGGVNYIYAGATTLTRSNLDLTVF